MTELNMEQTSVTQESKGFYKLNWLQRIGFGSGDLAQNLIYQTICMYLLFFYTDIYGLNPGVAATMFLVVRLVDVLWDPLVGTYVDKHNPRWGKYRSYLVLAGLPLTVLAILCFWNGMEGQTETIKLIYAYVTYVGLSMLYTLINVPYGALNSSLTRDTDEITILTSVRMFMANVGGLCVSAGVPILVAMLAAAKDLPIEMALFMGLGSLPSFIFMPLVPAIKKKVGKKNMFYIFLTVAIVGMAMLYFISKMGPVKDHITLVYIAQFIKSTGPYCPSPPKPRKLMDTIAAAMSVAGTPRNIFGVSLSASSTRERTPEKITIARAKPTPENTAFTRDCPKL